MAPAFSAPFIRGIDANRTVKGELTEALNAPSPRHRISVTDLVNPRQAFFRRTHPEVTPPPDKAQLMLAGTGFHDLFGRAVSSEEFLEQFLEFEGIVGKVDIFEDVPIELKTTGSIPKDIVASRPSYVDQLGMYCTMAGQPLGRLLVYRRQRAAAPGELKAFQAEFLDLEPIAQEMRRRRDALQEALDAGDPMLLGRCDWLAIGCDYHAICGCEEAPGLGRMVKPAGVRLQEVPEVAQRLLALASDDAPSPSLRLNSLVFPRKAFFEATALQEGPRKTTIEEQLPDFEQRGFLSALFGALQRGTHRRFQLEPVTLGSLHDLVRTYGGAPTLLRGPRWREMAERERLAQAFPHYLDRLAFECALTGSETGRLLLYYPLIPGDKWMVYDVHFTDLEAIQAEASRRVALLESGASPEDLPACPNWMARYCEYAPRCGCGDG